MARSKEVQEEAASKLSIFGYPVKDWVFLLALLGGGTAGVFTIGGTPGQTTDAIKELSDRIESFQDIIDLNSITSRSNSIRLDAMQAREDMLEARIDTLRMKIDAGNDLLIRGLSNIDGWLRVNADSSR